MDLQIVETLNGGDAVLLGNDLAVIEGLENMIYLALFGDDGTWWGNDLLLTGDSDKQFLSQTEAVLDAVTLNSAGRIAIEQAIKADLAFLLADVPGTTLSVSVAIAKPDRTEITITLNGKDFYFQINPN
jgi:phage gp46-like protein